MKPKFLQSSRGFNLIEVMLAIGVFGIFSAGMLKLYTDISNMNTAVDAKSTAYVAMNNLMDEIRSTNFNDIATNYSSGGTPGPTFSLSPLNGVGVISLDTTVPGQIGMAIRLHWQDKTGRYIGEDRDMDGTLDTGGDEMLSSEAISYAQNDAYRYSEERLGIDWMNEMEASYGFITLMNTFISDFFINNFGATIDSSEAESFGEPFEVDLYNFLIGPDWKAEEGKSSEISRNVRESLYTYIRDTLQNLPPSENEDENGNGMLDSPETFVFIIAEL